MDVKLALSFPDSTYRGRAYADLLHALRHSGVDDYRQRRLGLAIVRALPGRVSAGSAAPAGRCTTAYKNLAFESLEGVLASADHRGPFKIVVTLKGGAAPAPAPLCGGDGECLYQSGAGYVADARCPHQCSPRRCPGCGEERPQHALDGRGGECEDCAKAGVLGPWSCLLCEEPLAPAGRPPADGGLHPGWDARRHHKRCFLELQRRRAPKS